jgi:putative endopeptidase
MKRLLIVLLLLLSIIVRAQDGKEYFLQENTDKSNSPANDFFNFANGTFIKNHPIPPDEAVYGIFNLVEDSVYVYLKNICLEAMKSETPNGSNMQKIGDFFRSGMDTAAIQNLRAKPLEKWITKIDKIKDTDGLMTVIAQMHSYGISPLFGFYVGQDLMNSNKNVIYLYQGGIGLPDRDYYFNKDTRTVNIRKEYVNYTSRLLVLAGYDKKSADENAKTIFKIETELAKASRKLEDLRDDYANYNKMTLKELNGINPSAGWEYIFNTMGAGNLQSVIVGQPEFFKNIENILDDFSIEELKVYLKWELFNSTADLLSSDFEKEHFGFYGKTLSGTPEQRERWKRILDNTNDLLGEILGMEYVRLYFPPEDKVRTLEIVDNIIKAFGERIKNLDWMSEHTKQSALKKLGTIVKKIGYPDKWRDYSTLDIGSSYAENVLNAWNWYHKDGISKLYKPVDRTRWEMNPQTYNAYYNPSNNEIVIPAAILTVPGKKMSEVDDAFLYGFIGASTIGHEITHGFDDQGRNYDSEGNLKGWWTPEDSSKFVVRSQLMIDQFNNYLVLDSMHINGKATLGENIADLGGLVIAYDAMKMTKDGKENQAIGGFTADQRYFLGYAYSWAVYYRDEMLARRVMTDVHSPPFLRVNGPMANINEFYSAFGIKEGDKLFRDEKVRVKIW